jgi:mitochondrial import receptor subunit TOM70
MAEPVPIKAAHIQTSSSSLWDRVSNWVSENKAVAYTIAGTVGIVTGAGVIYYLSDSKKTSAAPSSDKKKSKKERRKEKKDAEEAQRKGGIALRDEESGTS